MYYLKSPRPKQTACSVYVVFLFIFNVFVFEVTLCLFLCSPKLCFHVALLWGHFVFLCGTCVQFGDDYCHFLGHFAISSCIFSLLVVICVHVWGFSVSLWLFCISWWSFNNYLWSLVVTLLLFCNCHFCAFCIILHLLGGVVLLFCTPCCCFWVFCGWSVFHLTFSNCQSLY